ncbi:hypothetical protein ACF0H5_005369 [Mactra antiquata]
MELTEVVSPSVAVPVLCVLVCAFLVFAFGFKSPAQPPSFDVFDDDGKKKRTKKSKGSKSQTNGHAVVSGDGDANNSAKPQSSPRQTVKQSTKAQSAVTAKSKSSPQVNQELPKKTKKQAAKEEEVKSAKVAEQIEEDFGDEWHMVPKKDKKQKKKDTESKQEKHDISPIKDDVIVAKVDVGVASAAPSGVDSSESPQEQRNKKKKDKKNKKAKQDDEIEQTKQEPAVEEEFTERPAEKRETSPVVDNIELQIKEAMETTVEDTVSGDKKKKNKKDKKKALPSPEEDDFVIPTAAAEQETVNVGREESVDNMPLKENTDALTVKIPKKKQKKDRNKKNEESIEVTTDTGASVNTDTTSLSQTIVSDSQPKNTKQEVKETSSEVDVTASSDINTNTVPVFDELGTTTDSWTEAKPKSKKKKARRAD